MIGKRFHWARFINESRGTIEERRVCGATMGMIPRIGCQVKFYCWNSTRYRRQNLGRATSMGARASFGRRAGGRCESNEGPKA